LQLNKVKQQVDRRQTLQKYQSGDLINFCAIYEAQNADNARTLRI